MIATQTSQQQQKMKHGPAVNNDSKRQHTTQEQPLPSTSTTAPPTFTPTTLLFTLAPSCLLLLMTLPGSAHGQNPVYSERRAAHAAPRPHPFNAWVAGSNNCTCVRELAQLKKEMVAETQQRNELKGALETYVSELYDLRAMVKSLRNSTPVAAEKYSSVANAKGPPSISFSSKLSYNRELKPLDTVVFDTVITNNGEAYNAETGKFTAPLPGTYMFFATVLSGYNTKVETALIINDKEVVRMYSGAHDAHGSGSNAAIVNLRSGDSVWVRLLYQGGNHVHGYYSTFSGAIITEQKQE